MRSLWQRLKSSDQRLFDWGLRQERGELLGHVAAVRELLDPDEGVDDVGIVHVGPWIGTYPFVAMHFKHLAVLTGRRFILFKISPWRNRPSSIAIAYPTANIAIERVKPKRFGLPLSLLVGLEKEKYIRVNFSALHERVGMELLRRVEQR